MPDRVAHHHRDEDAALDELEDDVDAGDDDRQLGGHGRCDEHRRDRAEERADDRDRLGQRRDQRQQERTGQAEQGVGDARRDAHRAHQDELAADPQPEPRLDLVPGVARAGAPVGRQEREQ